MRFLFRSSLAALAVAYAAVMLGSWTRIEGAGMTIPDWPWHPGVIVPSMSNGTVWEWTHRLLVFLLSPLVAIVVVAAWKQRKRPFIGASMYTVAALFIVQVSLGAATVRLSNSPMSVVLHWGTAMAFIASLAATAIFAKAALQTASAPARSTDARLVGIMMATALVAFATMCIGAYVSSSGAGLACISIPGCAGAAITYTPGQFVQMLHRFSAAVTLLVAVAAFALAWSLRASKPVRAAASVGLALVFVQVLLGLLNVALRLPLDLREAHAANAALTFLAFVVAAMFAALDGASDGARAIAR